MLKNQPIINGEVFVIPNGLTTINNVIIMDTKAMMENIFYANGLNKIDYENTKFVELWYCTPGHDNSNWVDHGVEQLFVPISKEEFLEGRDDWRVASSLLPVELFTGKKEGDVVTVKLPIRRHTGNGSTEISWIKASLALAQTKYRYKRFGRFEDLINR